MEQTKFQSDHTLPAYDELFLDDKVAYKHNELLERLNHPVKAEWVKQHDQLSKRNKPHWYLPIDKVNFLLNRFFGYFHNFEIIRYSTELNSAVVHCRLNYCIPGTNVWLFKDGIGAVDLQTASGAPAADLSRINAGAGQKAYAAAFSFAKGNAAKQLGKIFGQDLNKEDSMPFTGLNDINDQNRMPVDYGPDTNQPAAPVQTPQMQSAPTNVNVQQPPIWNPQQQNQQPTQQPVQQTQQPSQNQAPQGQQQPMFPDPFYGQPQQQTPTGPSQWGNMQF